MLKLVRASELPKRRVKVFGEDVAVVPLTKSRTTALQHLAGELSKPETDEGKQLELLAEQFNILLDPPQGDRILATYEEEDDLTMDQLLQFVEGLLSDGSDPN